MDAPKLEISLSCESDCYQWCPREVSFDFCCCADETSSSSDSSSIEEKTNQAAKNALEDKPTETTPLKEKNRDGCTLL